MSSNEKKKSFSTKVVPKKEILPTSEWSTEDKVMLMSRMQSHLGKTDTLKYTSALDKMPWEKVSFDSFSADDCKLSWTLLSREVRKFRTLTDLINDAREYLRDPYKGQIKKHRDYPKRPLTPYFQYFMEKRPAFAAKHPNMSNLNVTVELSKKYRELPESKKKKYVDNWKKETELFQKALKKFKEEHPTYFNAPSSKVHEPRTPVLIYRDEKLDEYSHQFPNMSKKESNDSLRNQYKALSDQEKQVYIEKALKEHKDYVVLMDKNSDNSAAVKKKPAKLILTKNERKLNDQYLGKPKKPPSNGYNLFCTETMPKLGNFSSQNRIVECARLWNLKTEAEKKALQKRYMEMKKEYEQNYKEFCKSLTPEERQKESESNKSNKKGSKHDGVGGHVIKEEPKEESSSSDGDSSDDDDDDIELNDSSDESDSEESDEDEDEDSDDEKDDEEEKKEEENDPETEKYQRFAVARPTTPISALFLFQKAHRRKVEAQYPGHSADEITRLLARRYHELPEHKRHKYLQKEKEQRALYIEKMQNFIKEETMKKNGVQEKEVPAQPQPVTGEQIYQEKLMSSYMKKSNNNKAAAERSLRNAWSKMNKGRREPFIVAAQERNEQNIAAYREAINVAAERHVATNSDKGKPHKRLKLAGEPKRPPTNGYQLFSASRIGSLAHLSQNEKFKEIGRLWTELAPDKKKAYQDEAKKGSERYKQELATWLKKLPKDVAAQYIEQAENAKKRKKPSASTAVEAKKAKLQILPPPEEQKDDEKASSESDGDTDSSSSDEESDDDDSEDDSSSSAESSDSDDTDDDSSDDDDSSSSESE